MTPSIFNSVNLLTQSFEIIIGVFKYLPFSGNEKFFAGLSSAMFGVIAGISLSGCTYYSIDQSIEDCSHVEI